MSASEMATSGLLLLEFRSLRVPGARMTGCFAGIKPDAASRRLCRSAAGARQGRSKTGRSLLRLRRAVAYGVHEAAASALVLPLPLAGEGWGEGTSTTKTPKRTELAPAPLERVLLRCGIY
jgi:hypothetical protein